VSPGNGVIRFGWDQPLMVDQTEIQLKNYRRYENLYSTTDFHNDEIKLAVGERSLSLNWKTWERRTG
jgi:hypothetical protein